MYHRANNTREEAKSTEERAEGERERERKVIGGKERQSETEGYMSRVARWILSLSLSRATTISRRYLLLIEAGL